ncbi:MAG TPA: MBL fold metallo-hydrolase [Chloroflexota bacterium]|jgi:glyoxylase-like metal-dependent hydrolase (beta-lactamase superfamily II)|nr:MBL fold metallo-hydrolase [Chloroflexota bacterium]
MTLQVRTLVCGPLQNNVYIVSSGSAAIVVDAPLESVGPITRALAEHGLTLTAIVCTHGHFDHMAEAAELARRTAAPVLVHALDADRLRTPARPVFFPDLEVEPVEVTRELAEGDRVEVGEVSLEVLHTAGHTPGSLCLLAEGVLLSGDTLFAGSFGRYDLPGGDAKVLRASLIRLRELPAGTRVLPGHGPETTIGRERWLANPPL